MDQEFVVVVPAGEVRGKYQAPNPNNQRSSKGGNETAPVNGRCRELISIRLLRRGGTCRTFARSTGLARRSRRAQFFSGQFSIAVFVERLEGLAGLLDFGGVDGTIAVGVEGCH